MVRYFSVLELCGNVMLSACNIFFNDHLSGETILLRSNQGSLEYFLPDSKVFDGAESLTTSEDLFVLEKM